MTKEKLANIGTFKSISNESVEQLLEYATLKEYATGSYIFSDKEDVDTVYIVISGIVSLYKINEQGQKRVIFMLGAGNIINEVIIDDLPASINCEVFEKATILCYKKRDFLSIMEKDFVLTKNVINSLSIKVRRMYRQLKNTMPSTKIEKRLAAKLLKLSKDYGVPHKEGILIDMNISITYLADLIGSQRETVSKSLKLLSTKGLIKQVNRKIIVCNQKELSTFFKAP